METIASRSDLPKASVAEALESLAGRNMIFTGKTRDGAKGYALLQVGYGMPQAFFWGGKKDETDSSECIGCGACADICPVEEVEIVDDKAVVDPDWCIGCGVCAVSCPTGDISIKRRSESQCTESVSHLYQQVKLERGLD